MCRQESTLGARGHLPVLTWLTCRAGQSPVGAGAAGRQPPFAVLPTYNLQTAAKTMISKNLHLKPQSLSWKIKH